MTTLTIPTPLEKDANPRPLPWRRMAWVTWRHHRIALGGVVVFLGLLAVWLWRAGLQLHHAYAAAIDCHPAGSTACSELVINFDTTGGILKGGFVLQPVPALSGPSSGHWCWPVRLETGTFRFARRRRRWRRSPPVRSPPGPGQRARTGSAAAGWRRPGTRRRTWRRTAGRTGETARTQRSYPGGSDALLVKRWLKTVNPATGEVLATFPLHGRREVEAAVAQAHEAAALVGRAGLVRAAAAGCWPGSRT